MFPVAMVACTHLVDLRVLRRQMRSEEPAMAAAHHCHALSVYRWDAFASLERLLGEKHAICHVLGADFTGERIEICGAVTNRAAVVQVKHLHVQWVYQSEKRETKI